MSTNLFIESEEVIQGDTFRVKATIQTYDGVALDPDSHLIRLLDPDGTQVGNNYTSPSKQEAGIYTQAFSLAADAEVGTWRVQWTFYVNLEARTARLDFGVTE